MRHQVVISILTAATLTLNSTVLATDRLVPSQYPTIQAGIDAAINGDTVIVAKGTYTGAGNRDIDFKGKAITVRSTDPNDPNLVAATVIDCENSGRGFYFHNGEEANSVLAGLTIRNGYTNFGGGIRCTGSSPIIENCIISNNAAQGAVGSNCYGGGIFCNSGSNPRIVSCRIINNKSLGGDDYYAGHAFGGGIYCSSDCYPTIKDCQIINNWANGGCSWYDPPGYGGHCYGGGVYGRVKIANCVVRENVAGACPCTCYMGHAYGAGMFCLSGSLISNCLVVRNEAIGYWSMGAGINAEETTISNCTIANNWAMQHVPKVVEGVYGNGTTTITDCILWGNGDDLMDCSSSYSCIQDGDTGEGNIDANPCFVTGPEGDYYLSQIAAGQAFDSPCVDAGSDFTANTWVYTCTTRTDGVIDTGIVDMGYHYASHFGSVDIDENLQVDCFDYSILAADWRNCYEESYPPGDITRDTCVNGKDLMVLVECWLDCYVKEATNPSPANEARGVDPNGTLGWVTGEGALYHDVYFGTDAEDVANADHLSPEFMGTVSEAHFDPCGLELETIYYWRVDEVGPACTTKGKVWNFTTRIEPIPGLISLWEFDEGEGKTAYDSTGTNDGIIYGAAWTTGQIGGALDFDGVDDYVDIPYDASLDIDASEGITLSVWIKLNSYPTGSDQGPIFGLFDSTGAGTKNYSAICGSIGWNVIAWDQYPPSGWGITSIKPDLDKWYHAAVVQDSSYRAIYINGSLDVSDNVPESYQGNTPDTIRIGSRADLAPFYFHGTIDDVRIYDRVLTAGEIWQLYQDSLN